MLKTNEWSSMRVDMNATSVTMAPRLPECVGISAIPFPGFVFSAVLDRYFTARFSVNWENQRHFEED